MLVEEICKELDIIIAIECVKDHVHLFLNTLPTLSPADTMSKIKEVPSKRLREESPHLMYLQGLWVCAYFISIARNVCHRP